MSLNSRLALREEDIIRISLEFLSNRELHISQLSLERETGVINGIYSDDVLFLRQLVLDGQWDDVLEFIQPLEALSLFDMKLFKYTILRHKYIELLCIRSEAGGITIGGQSTVEGAVEEVVQVLSLLEKFAPSKEEYSGLCLLLTLPRLSDHLSYKDWNPSKARVQCFKEVFPLVEKFLPSDKKTTQVNMCAKNDRLIQLVIKGLLYESCVNYCQTKATGGTSAINNGTSSETKNEINFCKVLDNNNGFTDSDLSLLSWLQSIPTDVFGIPFEQKTLNVDVERLSKPDLEASWTEHMLMTPIKPKIFPHSVMPFTRPRSAADIMTRSLMPSFDATVSSVLDPKRNGEETFGMSRSSFASFHLTGIKPCSGKMMTSSVDRLFESENDVFISNNFNEFQPQVLPSIDEIASVNSKSPEPVMNKDSPNTSTAKSSRRDSLNDRVIIAQNSSYSEAEPTPPNHYQQAPHHLPNIPIQSPPIHHMMQQQHQEVKQDLPVRAGNNHIDASARQAPDTGGGGELFEKFQQKQKIIKDSSTVGGQMGGKSSSTKAANGYSELGVIEKQGFIENESLKKNLNVESRETITVAQVLYAHYSNTQMQSKASTSSENVRNKKYSNAKR
ncbi:CLUMA_CG009681, isoform A, partial [Clunio marinus]